MNSNYSKDLKIFYTSISLYNFAAAVIQIFIPLFLLGKGFSISLILLFYALSQLGRLLFLPLAARLSSLYGAKKIIAASFVLQIIYFLLLREINGSFFYFIGSALVSGAMLAFLFLPYFVHISKISPNESRGRIMGKINIYGTIASSSGPLLGGLIIASYGFNAALVTAILFTIPAVVLLFLTPEVSKIRKINFSLINIRKIFPDLIANGFYNLQSFLDPVVWTIFIFIIIPQYKTIGFIQTVSLLLSVIGFYFIGKWTDRFNRSNLLLWGSVATTVVGILRVIAVSFAQIFALSAIFNFVYALQRFPWAVKLQERMDENARTEYMAVFEMGGTIVTILGLLILSILSSSADLMTFLVYGIIISSLSGLLANIVRK